MTARMAAKALSMAVMVLMMFSKLQVVVIVMIHADMLELSADMTLVQTPCINMTMLPTIDVPT